MVSTLGSGICSAGAKSIQTDCLVKYPRYSVICAIRSLSSRSAEAQRPTNIPSISSPLKYMPMLPNIDAKLAKSPNFLQSMLYFHLPNRPSVCLMAYRGVSWKNCSWLTGGAGISPSTIGHLWERSQSRLGYPKCIHYLRKHVCSSGPWIFRRILLCSHLCPSASANEPPPLHDRSLRCHEDRYLPKHRC